MLVEIPDNLLVNVPFSIWLDVLEEAQGIKQHGAVYLQIHFRDTNVQYYKTNLEKSNSVTLTKSEGDQGSIRNYGNNHSSMRKGMKK